MEKYWLGYDLDFDNNFDNTIGTYRIPLGNGKNKTPILYVMEPVDSQIENLIKKNPYG